MGQWYNAGSGELPKHNERVLISASGVYYICTFDSKAQLFKAENEQMLTVFKVGEPDMYWSRTESDGTIIQQGSFDN